MIWPDGGDHVQPTTPPSDDPQVLEDEFALTGDDEYDADGVMAAVLVPDGAGAPCYGVACIEGVTDGSMPRRRWEVGALKFAPTPFALKWQPAEAEGHAGAVIVGSVDAMWRDGALIRWVGTMDSAGAAGAEAQRLMAGNFLRGNSILADDMDQTDIELIYAEPELLGDEIIEAGPDGSVDDEDFHLAGKHNQKDHGKRGGPTYDRSRPPGTARRRPYERRNSVMVADASMDMAEPIEIVYHSGRVRSLTLLPEPAFVEATACLGESPFMPPITAAPPIDLGMVAAAVGPHDTPTTDTAWDGPAAEKRLASPMPVATARAFYAWIDDAQVVDGQIPKSGGRFGHHEVGEDGTPGAANIKACQSGIGVLNGGRGGTTIPAGDASGVYEHLAGHLRDAGLEPPPLGGDEEPTAAVVAAGYTITIPEVWPESWFNEPTELPPIGALNITADGRVYGLLAPAGVTHRAFRSQLRAPTAPRNIDYSEFQNKACLVAGADGGVYRINAGNITFDCGHASPVDPRRADPSWAVQHYDNSCSIAARVRVGENQFGTWVAGGLLHGISSDAVERMMACALSGDWQGGKLKAALLVPSEGFPTPVRSSVRVREDAIVASSVPIVFLEPEPVAEPDYDDLFDMIADAAGRTQQVRWAEVLVAAGRDG